MITKKPIVPSSKTLLQIVARELTAHAIELARDFFMMDPNEYAEFDSLPDFVLGAEDVRTTFKSVPYTAVVEATRITARVNLLREADKWEQITGEGAEMFAVRLTRQALGESDGLFTSPISDYELPAVEFSLFNPWDAGIGDWLTQEAMCSV